MKNLFIIASLSLIAGCQSSSNTVTLTGGGTVTVNSYANKHIPVSTGTGNGFGDTALKVAGAAIGGGAGAAIGGVPGAVAGAGAGYIGTTALQSASSPVK